MTTFISAGLNLFKAELCMDIRDKGKILFRTLSKQLCRTRKQFPITWVFWLCKKFSKIYYIFSCKIVKHIQEGFHLGFGNPRNWNFFRVLDPDPGGSRYFGHIGSGSGQVPYPDPECERNVPFFSNSSYLF